MISLYSKKKKNSNKKTRMIYANICKSSEKKLSPNFSLFLYPLVQDFCTISQYLKKSAEKPQDKAAE